MRIIVVIKSFILSRHEMEVKDNLKARRINTQLIVIQRILTVLIIVSAVSIILMTFEEMRQIGISILASAGIAGITLGIAAQQSLITLIAGIQIAVTQPIRIDDVIMIENEFGRVEEITLTYVVIRVWDQRRLIVPINYFIEKPFQNWTHTTAELLGTVYIYVDYRFPIDELRTKLEHVVQDSPFWDKRLVKLQVTNTSEKTIELRALVSAGDSSNAWDLRCYVREELLKFIQQHHPESLPRVRLEMEKME
jgi:small-conductance mechanosensitive channel